MSTFLDNSAVVPIPCPKCRHVNEKSVGWLKTNNEFVCGGCGKVTIETAQMSKGLRDAESDIAALAKCTQKIGRIKL